MFSKSQGEFLCSQISKSKGVDIKLFFVPKSWVGGGGGAGGRKFPKASKPLSHIVQNSENLRCK